MRAARLACERACRSATMNSRAATEMVEKVASGKVTRSDLSP